MTHSNDSWRSLDDGSLVLRYYGTDITHFLQNGAIRLNTGGFFTASTKRHMNNALQENKIAWRVFQEKRKWYARNWMTGELIPFSMGVCVIPPGTHDFSD